MRPASQPTSTVSQEPPFASHEEPISNIFGLVTYLSSGGKVGDKLQATAVCEKSEQH